MFFLRIFLFFYLFLHSFSFAQDFYVSTPEEFVNALEEASQNGQEDNIYVSSGTYYFSSKIEITVSDNKDIRIVGEKDRPVFLFSHKRDYGISIKYPSNLSYGIFSLENIIFKGKKVNDEEKNILKRNGISIETYVKDILIKNCDFLTFQKESLRLQSQVGNIFVFKSDISFSQLINSCVMYPGEDDEYNIIRCEKSPIWIWTSSGNIYLWKFNVLTDISDAKITVNKAFLSRKGNIYILDSNLGLSGDITSAIETKGKVNCSFIEGSLGIFAPDIIVKNSQLSYFSANHYRKLNLLGNVFGRYNEDIIESSSFIPGYSYFKEDKYSEVYINLINNTVFNEPRIITNGNKKFIVNIYNNILLGYPRLNITNPDSVVRAYNNIFKNFNTNMKTVYKFEHGNNILLPSFKNLFLRDGKHLKENAEAIDRGNDNAPLLSLLDTDVDGEPRIQGKSVDIGGDEYSAGNQNKLFYFRVFPEETLERKSVNFVFRLDAEKDNDLTCILDFEGNGTSDEVINNCNGEYIFTKNLNAGEYLSTLKVQKGNQILFERKQPLIIKSLSAVNNPPVIKEFHIDYEPIENEFGGTTTISTHLKIEDNDSNDINCDWYLYNYGKDTYLQLIYTGCVDNEFSIWFDVKDNKKKVILLAEDNDGNIVFAFSKDIVSYVRAPYIFDFSVKPQKGYIPLEVTLYFKIKSEEPAKCFIDFDNDGIFENQIENCLGIYRIKHTYMKEGTYTVKLIAESNKRRIEKHAVVIAKKYVNHPPKIEKFQVIPKSGKVPLGVFVSIDVTDEDGDPLTCKIDFDGDGNIDKVIKMCFQERVYYIYTDPGYYNLVLTVEDKNGLSITKQEQISVKPLEGNKKIALHFNANSFKALKEKFKIPDKLKNKSISIELEGNDNIKIVPHKAPIPVIGEEYIGDIPEYDFPYGLVSIKLENLKAGSRVYTVIELPDKIPENAVYVKYKKDRKVEEIKDIYSSSDKQNWEKGLISGYRYIKIPMEDGGELDEDGEVNGEIIDPSGVAVPQRKSSETGGGCSFNRYGSTNNWIIFLALFLLFVFKRRFSLKKIRG